jgi:hypothetical protein
MTSDSFQFAARDRVSSKLAHHYSALINAVKGFFSDEGLSISHGIQMVEVVNSVLHAPRQGWPLLHMHNYHADIVQSATSEGSLQEQLAGLFGVWQRIMQDFRDTHVAYHLPEAV